jgi:hypothetical protein
MRPDVNKKTCAELPRQTDISAPHTFLYTADITAVSKLMEFGDRKGSGAGRSLPSARRM